MVKRMLYKMIVSYAMHLIRTGQGAYSCMALSHSCVISNDTLLPQYIAHSQARTNSSGFTDIPPEQWENMSSDSRQHIRLERLAQFRASL